MEDTALDGISLDYRKDILDIMDRARRGHLPSALSSVEIIRVLYEDVLRVDPQNPLWPDRDRFILSKGHGCLALYVALARKGFFPRQELYGFCEFGAMLGGHPEYMKAPGVEASTGSLGHGLSVGIGIALSARLDGRAFRTFALLSDGECDEGSVWEAAMCASKHRLTNLTAIVDYNKMQCYGETCEVMDLEPFAEKWRSFGFAVKEVDGHDVAGLGRVFRSVPFDAERPSVVICHTLKGKGIHSIEHNANWHHKSKISDEEMNTLYRELGAPR